MINQHFFIPPMIDIEWLSAVLYENGGKIYAEILKSVVFSSHSLLDTHLVFCTNSLVYKLKLEIYKVSKTANCTMVLLLVFDLSSF